MNLLAGFSCGMPQGSVFVLAFFFLSISILPYYFLVKFPNFILTVKKMEGNAVANTLRLILLGGTAGIKGRKCTENIR